MNISKQPTEKLFFSRLIPYCIFALQEIYFFCLMLKSFSIMLLWKYANGHNP